MKKRILITGGGTGGHVYPAIATMEALSAMGEFEFLYVGGRGGIETRIIPEWGVPLRTIWISGFQRYLTWRNVLFPFKLGVSLVQSWWILRRFRPHLAIGTGGYVTGPVLFAAYRMGIPVLIEEQDVYPGITTRLLAPYARKICVAFEGAGRFLKVPSDRVVVTGNPVRRDLTAITAEEARRRWGIPPDARVVLVLGGSQGARSINQAMLRILSALLQQPGVWVLWQTGPRRFAEVEPQGRRRDGRVRLLPYIEDMAAAYAAADVVLTRAGALTLAELAVVQKPAILIPYPHAAGNHQELNARYIESLGAAVVIPEHPGWEKPLLQHLQTLLASAAQRQRMARCWAPVSRKDAARKIARMALDLLETNPSLKTTPTEVP